MGIWERDGFGGGRGGGVSDVGIWRAEGETERRTEEGKGETNGCKMEKRNGFIAATDATNNRATPAATQPHHSFPRGRYEKEG